MPNGAKHWCFTTNNYEEKHVLQLRALAQQDEVQYLIFGRERGDQGTPHLQGYASFGKRKTLNQVRKLIPDSHLSVAKGTAAQNKTYCSKEGSFEEYGDPPSSQGKRSDLEEFKQAVKEGTRNKRALFEDHSEVCAKYPRFVHEYLQLTQEVQPPEPHPLVQWQQQLNDHLKTEPDDRQINFIVDKTGGKGKTWFAKYYCHHHEGKAQYMEMAKKADMAYAINPEIRVLFVNCTRQQVEFLNYSFLESVKDGMIFSPKYESKTVRMNKCHVVVLMNELPDMTKLSADRYLVVELD